jgi:four helix bundle protein
MGGKMNYDFENLNVYRDAEMLAEEVYLLSMKFPREDVYGITSQLRRAAISVPLNIAEGKGRYHTKVFIQFLYQARGSLYETIAILKIGVKLRMLTQEQLDEIRKRANAVAGQLNNLIKSMR